MVIILSKAFGLLRDIITAGYFGTGVANDAYASAYSLFYLPVLLFSSCITATIVPLFVEEREKYSLEHSNRFASNALNLFLLASLAISAVMYIFAEPLVNLIYQFDAEGIALTAKLTRIMMLGLAFNVASIVLSSLLNAMERFMAAQLTGFPLSAAVIAAAVGFSGKYGVTAIAWGVFTASVLQVVVQIPFVLGWFKYTPQVDFRDKRFHRLLKLAGPAVLSMGISEINHLIDRSLASGLPTGSISAMNYAYKLITFLLGVLMVPLTTIMFSKMSKMAADEDKSAMLASLRRSIVLISLVTLPILAVAMVMSNDVVQMIYMRGSFGMDSVLMTGGVLLFYLIGVPAFGFRDFLNRTFHAIQDTRTPFRVACLVVALNIALNIILRKIMGANGLALATSVSSYTGMITMMILLKKKLGSLGLKQIAGEMAKLRISAALSAIVCVVMDKILFTADTTIEVFFRLVITTAAAFAVYLISCLVLRVQAIRQFTGVITRRAN